jgi:hypothetical protein
MNSRKEEWKRKKKNRIKKTEKEKEKEKEKGMKTKKITPFIIYMKNKRHKLTR